jgi:hypothetical protein
MVIFALVEQIREPIVLSWHLTLSDVSSGTIYKAQSPSTTSSLRTLEMESSSALADEALIGASDWAVPLAVQHITAIPLLSFSNFILVPERASILINSHSCLR